MTVKNYMFALILLFCAVGLSFTSEPVQAVQSKAIEADSQIAPSEQAHPKLEAQLSDEWLQYESKAGGYSFSYPSTYSVVEMERGFVQLRVNGEVTDDTIALYYVMYQMDDLTDDLLTWAEALDKHHVLNPFDVEYFPAHFDETNASDSRQIYIESRAGSAVPFQSYWMTNGRLVLQVSANFEKEENKSILEGIARSVKFSKDAPTDMSQLYAPEAPPSIATLSDFLGLMREKDEVSHALNVYVETGETPTDLLDQMTESARADYERTLQTQQIQIQQAIEARQPQEAAPVLEEVAPAIEEMEGEPFTQTFTLTSQLTTEAGLAPEIELQFAATPAANAPQSYSAASTQAIANRQGLPARFKTPIRVYNNIKLRCGSALHNNNTWDGYAADIGVVIGTNVYATTQNERVYRVETSYSGDGYGKYVQTYSTQFVRGIQRTYYNTYAHLNGVNVVLNQVLGPGDLIGTSGTTGVNPPAPHLHFSISTDVTDVYTGNLSPTDLSPVKGITPNIYYPSQWAECGWNRNPDTEPIIIEANEFQASTTGSGYSWNCSTYLPNHTGTCYRAAVPTSPNWTLDRIDNSNKNSSPRMSYNTYIASGGNYRVWVCGMGGNSNDDSIHMGRNNDPQTTADAMTGWSSSNWIWMSWADGADPYLYLPTGYVNVDVWARENGMRVDRILLSKNFDYNPAAGGVSTRIRCGAEGL